MNEINIHAVIKDYNTVKYCLVQYRGVYMHMLITAADYQRIQKYKKCQS